MKAYLSRVTVAIASLFLSVGLVPSAQAYSFDQEEVDQSKFIAIAVPFAEGKQYNLIILEQISATQSCWEEQADQPGVIDPLLLQFDFTGICGRSTDSNGYSIRQAGQDYALDYRLSVVKKNGNLVLMGHPLRNPQAPKLKIGQTQGLADGFLKIELEPGWRFAKRSYNGKTLGHIYFTRDQQMPTIDVPTVEEDTIAEAPADAVPPLEGEEALPAGDSDDRLPLLESAPQAPAVAPPPPPASDPKVEDKSESSQARDELTKLITSPIEIPVPKPEPSRRSVPPIPPSHARRTPDEIALPRPETDPALPELAGENPPPPLPSPQSNRYQPDAKANQHRKLVKLAVKPPLPTEFFSRPIPIPVPPPRRAAVAPIPGVLPPVPGSDLNVGDILPVPQQTVPLGRYRPASDIYAASQDAGRARQLAAIAGTGNPPPPPLDERSRLKYRVLVKSVSSAEYQKIKALVPDAFRSRYQGRSVIQVGAYETQAEATERLDTLSLEGIQGILDIR